MSAFKPRDAAVVRRLTLDLSLAGEKSKTTEKIARSLSGVEQQGECLFVGSDEGPGFERLRRTGEKTYGRREKFGLGDFFKGLPGKDKDEADVESISVHILDEEQHLDTLVHRPIVLGHLAGRNRHGDVAEQADLSPNMTSWNERSFVPPSPSCARRSPPPSGV
jgi:hypothetical protein